MKHHSCDICVVGGGPAGLYAVNQLANSGLKIILVEIGDKEPKDESFFNLAFNQIGKSNYRGSTEGRSFGIGGTSYLWGGSLLPFTRADFEKEDHYKNGFNSMFKVFDEFNHEKILKNLLGKSPKSELISNWKKCEYNDFGFYEVNNVFIPFDKKDFSSKKIPYNAELFASHKLEKFNLSKQTQNGKLSIESIVCLNIKNNEKISIESSNFFLCAGALESTYLISKLINENCYGFIDDKNKISKYFFNDHLSNPIIKILPSGRKKINGRANKSIEDGLIYGNRYIFDDTPTRSFFHFTADTQNSKGFNSLRELAYSIQQRRLPNLSKVASLDSLTGLLDYSKQRFLDKKLFIPDDSEIFLSYDFETPYSEERYLKFDHLSNKRFIKWGLSKSEEELIETKAKVNGEKVLTSFGLKLNDDFEFLKKDFWNPYDVYHPSGSLYRTFDPLITYPSLRFSLSNNLYVFSTASLPSAGTANPTYSLLMMVQNTINTLYL